MPRLLLFAPCEKVISAQEDNGASLIALLQGFELPTQPPEENLMAPIPWYAFALWEAINEEPGRFSQRIQLVARDGTILVNWEGPVVGAGNRGKRFHRTAIKHLGFPLHGTGDYTLRLWLRDGDGEFNELVDRAFPIPISVNAP
jgi:hypothetical protein